MLTPLSVALALAAVGACTLWAPVGDAGFDRYHLPKELWLSACALAAALACWQRRQPADRLEGLVAAVVGASAAAAVAATSPALALRGVQLTVSAAVLFFAARRCSPDEVRLVRWAWLVGGAAVAAVALGEAAGTITGLSGPGRAPGSTLGQRNMVAHLLVVLSPLAWHALAKGPGRSERLLGAAATMLFAGAVVVTRTRAAWVSAPVVLAAWLMLQRRGPAAGGSRWALAPVAAVVVAAALTAQWPAQLRWRAQAPYRDTLTRLVDTSSGSGLGRLLQYGATLRLIAMHPLLGVGPGNWLVEYPSVSPPSDPTLHPVGWLRTGRLLNSDPLAFAAENGVPAFLLAAALAWAWARRAWPGPDRDLALATLAAALCVGALDAVLQLPAPAAAAAFVLGAAVPIGPPTPARPTRWWPRAMVVGLLATAVVLSTARLAGLMERTHPDGGFAHAEAAVKWNPADLTARFALVEAYVLEGDCARASPHLQALRALVPRQTEVQSMQRACAAQAAPAPPP